MKNVILAEPSLIPLAGIELGLLFLLILSGVILLLIIYYFLRPSKKPTPAQPPAVPATQIIPRKCPQCGAELKPGVSEGLCPACLLQRGIATEGGLPPGTPPFVPPTIPDLVKLFPQLEILELIGKGGMGAVYKARQPALDRFVALKIIAPRPGSDLDFTSRFTREARALAKLTHPNIVGVYDFGAANGLNYFIMEYVDGPNLRQIEQAGKLSAREALEIIPQICAALQFAHDEGIVHRDIKPENVLLDKKGRVKIADFGLAKILGQEPDAFRLTGARDVVGTPHYMAPEQVEKPQEVDHRADIYSLGVVFYEMLTGELPLGKFQPPSSSTHGMQIDVRLDEVVLRALEKAPERRYQQASQVKTAVETIASTTAPGGNRRESAPSNAIPPGVVVPATPQKSDRFWRRFAVVIAVVMACVVLIPVAIAVIGMLAAIAIPNFVKGRNQALALREQTGASQTTGMASNLAFGPVIERVINPASTKTNFLISFKTGNLRTPPPEIGSSHSTVYDWARREGVDAGAGIINKDVLSGFDMAMVHTPAQCWEELTSVQIVRRLDSQPLDSWSIMSYGNASLPDTCVFKTREGGIGILQVTEYVSDPPGLKVRYKFLETPPVAAQTESKHAAGETWSPNLLPGETPDMDKIYQEAKDLTAKTCYVEALQRHLWYHDHAREFSKLDWNIYILPNWVELGRRYPKAKEALVKIRDHNTREIAEGRGYLEMFQEVQAINRELQDDDATCALFKTIRKEDPKLAEHGYWFVEDLLVSKGEYELCLACIGEPQARFNFYLDSLERQRASQQRMDETRKQFPTPGYAPPDMGKMATNHFAGQVRTLVEILVGTGQKTVAEKIRDQAVATLDDPRLKSAVSDAEEKIQKRLTSTGSR